MRSYRVFFQPAGKLVQAQPGENLLRLAQRAGVHLQSSCGGNGSCRQCRVKILDGRLEGKMIASSPARFVDATTGAPVAPSETVDGVPMWLSCRGCVMGDMVVEAAPRTTQARTLVRKQLLGRRLEIDRPDLPAGSLVAAIDMGSTTLAGYLVSLEQGEIIGQASRENSQIPWGGDILTRVSHTERDPAGFETLKRLLREDVNAVLELLLRQAKGRPVASLALCGNSVMQSFLMGWDVLRLGSHPFEPQSTAPQLLTGQELGLTAAPGAEVYVLPLEAGFVGGDNVAAILACGLDRFEGTALLLDIGTNAEIVAGGRKGLIVGSTPTGPAFEGGQITFGMRAARGAIESIDFAPDSTRPLLRVIGSVEPQGLCGSAIIDIVAALRRAGIVDAEGRMLPSRFTRERDDGMREVWLCGPGREAVTPEGIVLKATRDIVFTQKDLREVQLAKAALATGAELLLKRLGRAPDRVILAGGFGSYIDIESAIGIGLLPDLSRERIEVAGNAAGLGACMVAASLAERSRAERIARATLHIPLPDEPEFQDLLLRHCALP
jgi:uncharacterized 2Fe-2S/4Fe-4S cluster protein (DUF4445 family)